MDTNVVSELTSDRPNLNVMAWFARQLGTDLYITAVNEAELLFGTENLPFSRRRSGLETANHRMVEEILGGRVLPFDRAAARAYAVIFAARQRTGFPIGELDCQIAAIARAHSAAVATRDIGGFENCGIEVIDPRGNWGDRCCPRLDSKVRER